MTNFFESKAKNIMAIIFSCFYAFMTFIGFDFNFAHYANLRYAVNTISSNVALLLLPVAVIVFIALRKKDFTFKKWLLPIAFGLMLVKSAITLYYSVMNTITVFDGEIHVTVLSLLIITALSFVAIAVMFVGTLGDFRLAALLKYGALSYAVITLLFLVFDFIAAGGLEYFEKISDLTDSVTFWIIYIRSLMVFIAQILFYIGLFILFPAKKKAKEQITA